MLELVITIVLFTFFTVCFKLYEKYNVHNFSAIIVNYLTAGLLGFFLSNSDGLTSAKSFNDILIFSSIIGILFITAFNLIAYSTQKTGIAKTILVSKIGSIGLPVAFALLFTDESAGTTKIIALGFAILSLFFMFTFKKKNALSQSALLILLGIFLGQGAADILFDLSETKVEPQYAKIYFSFIFLFAAAFGLIFSFFNKKQRFQFSLKNVAFGVLLGVPNYFSLYFFFKALSKTPSSVAFPVLNIGIIILSALVGLILFKEKITRKNAIGLSLAAISIYLITRS